MALDNGDVQKIARALGPIIDEKIDAALTQYHDANVAQWLEVFNERVNVMEQERDEFETRAMNTIVAMGTNEFFADAWRRFIYAEGERLMAMEEAEKEEQYEEPPEEVPAKVVKKVVDRAD